LVAAPWWGRRGDRLGFNGALMIALLGAALILGLQGVVASPAQLLVVRFTYGFFIAGVLPNLLGIVTQKSPIERRGGMMALCSSAIMLGNLVGPLGGGYLASQVGLRPVFVGSALAVGALCGAFWILNQRRSG
jgi:DHA1 family multidrug resistance protein-like MFS transporter